MKMLSWLLLAAASIFMLGCAQLPDAAAQAEPDYDVAKVAAIEQYALHNNVKILWINYPQARKR
jgi:ABC-type glycerol-3-phosphate transport system substrate-binding protein